MTRAYGGCIEPGGMDFAQGVVTSNAMKISKG